MTAPEPADVYLSPSEAYGHLRDKPALELKVKPSQP